jgi:hypothetical protein
MGEITHPHDAVDSNVMAVTYSDWVLDEAGHNLASQSLGRA